MWPFRRKYRVADVSKPLSLPEIRKEVRILLIVGFVITLVSPIAQAQTIAVKSEQLSLGAAIWVPVILNAAPHGLHHATFSVSLDAPEIAEIEAVRFEEPMRSFAGAEIADDGNSVRISVQDSNDVLRAGAQQITFAELKLRGTFGGKTGLTITVHEIVDDRLNAFNVAVKNGQLQVAAAPGAPSLVVGSDGTLIGDTVRVPVILTSTVGGVKNYRVTVRIERRDIATFLGSEFPYFAGQTAREITPDGDEITIAAQDAANAVRAGAKGVILAWLVLRGDLESRDGSPLRLMSNNIVEDNGNSVQLPSINGLLKVTRIENLPPRFYGAFPAEEDTIGDPAPTISITISDEKNEVMPESIKLSLRDSSQTLEFGWQSTGAYWDQIAHVFTVNLKAIGARLSGEVRAHIEARDRQGAKGWFDWRFRVSDGPPKTIEELLDTDRDNRLGDLEILRALDFWVKGTELAPGLKIDDLKMLSLLDKWIKGTPLRASAVNTFRYGQVQPAP